MISTPQQSHLPRRWDDSVAPNQDDVCRRQLAEAERETGAYCTAVAELFGEAAAAKAAECWIELVEAKDLPAFDDHRNWREITILAASRLAIETQTSAPAVTRRTYHEAPTGKAHHNDQCRA